jgi:hypothetical protein
MPHQAPSRALLAVAALAAALANAQPPAATPPQSPPSALSKLPPPNFNDPLDALLVALEANIDSYNRSVPGFLCNEHVSSNMEPTTDPGGFRHDADSVFRVRRAAQPNGTSHLVESRTLKTLNGKPAPPTASDTDVDPDDPLAAAPPQAPMAVFGIFSNGINLVAYSGKLCFRYKLHPARPNHPKDRIVVDFEELPPSERDDDCPSNGKISGKETIDQATRRAVRLQTTTTNHLSQFGYNETWEWTIEYAPVTLSTRVFWLPTTIRSRAVPDINALTAGAYAAPTRRGGPGSPNSARPLTYTLEAKYTDYHLLNVTSRIVIPTANPDLSPTPDH